MIESERPDWHARARCGRNGVIGDDPAKRVRIMFTLSAGYVCVGCPVREECAAAGQLSIRKDAGMGVWGGQSPTGRLRACVVCDEMFTSSDRRTTCSDFCRVERLRLKDAERRRQQRLRDDPNCCTSCGRTVHTVSCPERPGKAERLRAFEAEFGPIAAGGAA